MRFRWKTTKTNPKEQTDMPDINSIASKVDALTNLVDALRSERDTLLAQNADLATQLAVAQAAAVDPTVLNIVDQKLDATILSLTPERVGG